MDTRAQLDTLNNVTSNKETLVGTIKEEAVFSSELLLIIRRREKSQVLVGNVNAIPCSSFP
jgi:hypothetical protein